MLIENETRKEKLMKKIDFLSLEIKKTIAKVRDYELHLRQIENKIDFLASKLKILNKEKAKFEYELNKILRLEALNKEETEKKMLKISKNK